MDDDGDGEAGAAAKVAAALAVTEVPVLPPRISFCLAFLPPEKRKTRPKETESGAATVTVTRPASVGGQPELAAVGGRADRTALGVDRGAALDLQRDLPGRPVTVNGPALPADGRGGRRRVEAQLGLRLRLVGGVGTR